MNEKLEQAKREGRLLTFTGRSSQAYPLLLAIDPEGTEIVHAPESTPPYQVHMLTRRTHLNPGETFSVAVLFAKAPSPMPEAAYFKLEIHLSNLFWSWSLNEDESNMTYNEISSRSKTYLAQLEAELKAERKRRRRTIARV